MFRTLYEQFGDDALLLQPGAKAMLKPAPQESAAAKKAIHAWPMTYQNYQLDAKPEHHVLTLQGYDGNETVLTLEALQKRTKITQNRRIISPQGWTFRADWSGIPLQDILPADVTDQAEAINLKQEGLNGQSVVLPLSVFLKQNSLLCWQVNQKTLPAGYGGPLRLMIHDRYFYMGLGQLSRLSLHPRTEDIEWQYENSESSYFWMERGYSPTGALEAGDYMATDLNLQRSLADGYGEITQF